MNFFPNAIIPNNIPINNMENPLMYINDLYNKFNELDNHIKQLKEQIHSLENKNNNYYSEPDNSMYMI